MKLKQNKDQKQEVNVLLLPSLLSSAILFNGVFLSTRANAQGTQQAARTAAPANTVGNTIGNTEELVIPPALFTAKAGRSAASELKTKSSLVPAFEIYKKAVVNGKTEVFRVKTIPKLDIGEEPTLSAGDFKPLALPTNRAPSSAGPTRLASPPALNLQTLESLNVKPATPAKNVVTNKPITQVPDVAIQTYPEVVPVLTPVEPTPAKAKKVEDFTPAKLKLLQALILLEVDKSYDMAMALFAELIEEKEVATEAIYQLGITSKALGLYSEYKFQLSKLLTTGTKEWQKRATISLASNAQQGDKALVAQLDPKIEELKLEFGVDIKNADQYHMNRAKYYLDKNNLTAAHAAIEEIDPISPMTTDAQFLRSVILYKGGHLQEAIQVQSEILKQLMQTAPDSELRSVSALTLARLHFQASQYKDAFDAYLKVDKKNPEWTQAMIEQAWAQILAEDYEGAAGNMFSLHTAFFKNSFTPESYVIRTVGYLNLCQFGDGARVINDFKKKYTPIQSQLESYMSKMTTPTSYYETVRKFVKNPDEKTVDTLPRNFIFELARHPSFLNEQKMINSAEDEIGRYNKITLDLIKKERSLVKSQNEAKSKAYDLKKKYDKANKEDRLEIAEVLNKENKKLFVYQLQSYIAKRARNSIKDMRAKGLARLEEDKKTFKTKASEAIKARFTAMRTTLKNTLDQSEVLNYELYSGAGEHLRYQMAGGDITDKAHKELKPAEETSTKWEFKGEIWEDELGHYRSSLKNVCPRDNVSQAELGK